MNLYTVIMSFSDHRQGIGQYEVESPLDALKTFIKESEALKGFDREKLLASIQPGPFIHLKKHKGFWIALFNPEVLLELSNSDGDKALGAHVVQSDPNGPERSA
jgi:hypothetical protein